MPAVLNPAAAPAQLVPFLNAIAELCRADVMVLRRQGQIAVFRPTSGDWVVGALLGHGDDLLKLLSRHAGGGDGQALAGTYMIVIGPDVTSHLGNALAAARLDAPLATSNAVIAWLKGQGVAPPVTALVATTYGRGSFIVNWGNGTASASSVWVAPVHLD